MFTGKITDLTVLRSVLVAGHGLCDVVRVEMAAGRITVAAGVDWHRVNVID